MSDGTLEHLLASKVIAIIRSRSCANLLETIHALVEGGITCVEVTMNTPGALDALRDATHELDGDDVALGVGTVLNVDDVRQALDAGARYVVTPTLNADVVRACKDSGVVVVPGAFTPSEAQHAWELGADIVKIFPAGTLGPGYVKSLLGPLPHLRLLPTGGLTPENAPDYLKAGAVAVGLGGALTGGGGQLDARAVTQRAESLAKAIREVA